MKFFRFLKFGRRSRSIAKDRLKILLIYDRADCSPEMMNLIKQDIISVLSQYMRIDAESTEIQISQSKNREHPDRTPSLYAHIPILDMHK